MDTTYRRHLEKMLPFLIAGFAFLIISLIISWPLITVMDQKLINHTVNISPDLEGTLWFHWWVKHAILTHQNKYFSDIIYYPVGRNLILLFKNALDCFLAVPLYFIFGFPCYYNVLCLLVLVFNGLALFALIRHFVKNDYIAFLTGFLVCFNHFVFFEIQNGRIIQTTIGLPALAILYFVKLLEEKEEINILLLSVMLLVNSLMYWFYGIFLVTFSVLFLIFYVLVQKVKLSKGQVRRLTLSFSLFLLMTIPLTLPFAKQLQRGEGLPETPFLESYPSLSQIMQQDEEADPRKHAIFSSAQLDRDIFYYPIALVTLGAFLPLFRMKENGYHWVLTFLSIFSLALGPYLILGGMPYNIKLPYTIFYTFVPFYSRLFWPLRVICIALLLMGILFAKNLDWILNVFKAFDKRATLHGKTFSAATVAIIILFLLSFGEMMYVRKEVPFELQSVKISNFFRYIAREKNCAIIEVPFLYCPKSIVNQIIHHQKILGGPGITVHWDYPPEFESFWKRNAFLAYLYNLNDLSSQKVVTFAKEDIDSLREMGFRFVVFYPGHCNEAISRTIHKKSSELDTLLSSRIRSALEQYFGAPFYEGDDIVVFDISRAALMR